MFQTKAYLARSKESPFEESLIPRRGLGPNDILIEVMFVGINYFDLKNYKDENSIFPMVPGLELTGVIVNKGYNVENFGIGEIVGVSKVIDTCRNCNMCSKKKYFNCKKGATKIYNDRNNYNHSNEKGFPTFGGLSQMIVVNNNYVIKIFCFGSISLDRITPFLYSGSLVYSAMKSVSIKKESKVGVIGMTNFGNIAVKLAIALGANVTVFDTNNKKNLSFNLKADEFININDNEELLKKRDTFDFILDARYDSKNITNFLELLKPDGKISIIDSADNVELVDSKIKKIDLPSYKIIKELIDLCTYNKIYCNTQLIYAYQINDAFERLEQGDDDYYFVIDVNSIDPINKKERKSIEEQVSKVVNKFEDDDKLTATNNLETYYEESDIESDSEV